MLETCFDLLSIFSTELFGVALAHAKHVAHTTTTKESALFLVIGVLGLTCLLTSVEFTVSSSINLEEKS